MSAATLPDDAAVGPPEHLHPLYLLSGFRKTLRNLSGAYALIAYFAVQGRWTVAVLAAVAILAIGIVVTVLRWLRFEFRVGDDEIRIGSGIFSRRHRSIPFDRIQDVDIVQGPFARVLGLAEVTFDTGGGGSGRHPEEGALHAISLRRAEDIRALIRGRRSPAPAAVSITEERAPIYRLSFGRLLLAGLFNFSLAVFAGLLGLTQTVGQPLGIDPFEESFWRNLAASSTPLEQFVLVHRNTAVAAGIALLIIVGILTGIVRTVLRDFGFRLDSTGTGLRRRRGLLTKTDVTLPVRRVQAALVVSGPVRERLGWAALLVQSLAQEEKSRGNHELAPLARGAEIDAIIEEIGCRPISGTPAWKRVSQAYLWAFALALAPVMVLAVAATTLLSQWAAAGLLACVVLIGVRALAWRRIGYILDGDRLLMRSGWWRRRLVVLPKARIQSIDFTQSFLARWLGMATLQFGVAGGRATTHIIPAIPTAEARALRQDLLSSLA